MTSINISYLNEEDNLIPLIVEALDLAQTACKLDSDGQYVIACEYYDDTILHLDEILNKLDVTGVEYANFLQWRYTYGRRLELLRNHEVGKKDMGTTLLLGSPSTPAGKGSMAGGKVRRMSRVAFDETMDPKHSTQPFSTVPTSFMRKPYHTLRTVRRTIENGAFLTPQSCTNSSGLYIPRVIWKQFNVKLSGIPAKITAFDTLIHLIEVHIETLCYPDSFDSDAILLVMNSFQIFIQEIIELQTSLSKPFPFIAEAPQPIKSAANVENAKEGGWSSMVAGFGKSVVKYAEVGYQRFGAMQTHISDEDFIGYSQLLLVLCEKCQLLDKWHDYVEKEREKVAKTPQAPYSLHVKSTNSTHKASSSVTGLFASVEDTAVEVDMSPEHAFWCQSLEGLLSDMCRIGVFLQDVVCEIILRDIEVITLRYMKKMRQSFARMHWDDDGGADITLDVVI